MHSLVLCAPISRARPLLFVEPWPTDSPFCFPARFAIANHPLVDRSRRRPFRLGRQQIAFVATDMGHTLSSTSNTYRGCCQAHLCRRSPYGCSKGINRLGLGFRIYSTIDFGSAKIARIDPTLELHRAE